MADNSGYEDGTTAAQLLSGMDGLTYKYVDVMLLLCSTDKEIPFENIQWALDGKLMLDQL